MAPGNVSITFDGNRKIITVEYYNFTENCFKKEESVEYLQIINDDPTKDNWENVKIWEKLPPEKVKNPKKLLPVVSVRERSKLLKWIQLSQRSR